LWTHARAAIIDDMKRENPSRGRKNSLPVGADFEINY
jgi:hypothetical protein